MLFCFSVRRLLLTSLRANVSGSWPWFRSCPQLRTSDVWCVLCSLIHYYGYGLTVCHTKMSAKSILSHQTIMERRREATEALALQIRQNPDFSYYYIACPCAKQVCECSEDLDTTLIHLPRCLYSDEICYFVGNQPFKDAVVLSQCLQCGTDSLCGHPTPSRHSRGW